MEIYAHVPTRGRPITIKVDPLPVDNNILGEEKISEAVTRIWMHRAGVPSGMKSKHLIMWHCTAKREENPNRDNWDKFVAIIEVDFRGGEFAAL